MINNMTKSVEELKEEREFIIIKKNPKIIKSLEKEDIEFKILNFVRYPFS
jgi:hypothetical protein